MERTKDEKHKDVKLAIGVMKSIIEILEDQSFSSVEKGNGMTTVILALILKVRAEYKGG